MLKSYLFISILLFVLVAITNAQTLTISKPIPISNKTSKFRFLGKNNIGYWVRNYGKNEERIDIYDEGMNLVKSKTLLIKRPNFNTISYFLGTSQATIYYTEYKKKTLYLCASNINDRLETSLENVLDTVKYQSYDDEATVSFASSTNKLFHVFFIPIYNEGAFKAVKVIATNGNSLALYRKNLDITLTGYTASPEDAIVNNEGNTFLLIKYDNLLNDSIRYISYMLSNKGEILNSFNVYFDRIVFGDPYILFDELKKEFIATSFTSDNEKQGANFFTTYRYSIVDPHISSTNHYKIDKEIIADIYKGDPGNITGLYTYQIKKVVLTYNSGLYVFTESFFRENKEEIAPDVLSLSPMNNFQPAYNNTRSVSVYHYNDILCFKLNDSLKSFNYELISKKQLSENDNGAYSSFALFNSGDKLKCFYNSEESGNYSLVTYNIDQKKELTKSILLNEEKKGVQLIPKMAIQTGMYELVIPSFRNDDFKLIKIKF